MAVYKLRVESHVHLLHTFVCVCVECLLRYFAPRLAIAAGTRVCVLSILYPSTILYACD